MARKELVLLNADLQKYNGAHGGETGIKVFFPWLKDHIKNYLRIEKMNV